MKTPGQRCYWPTPKSRRPAEDHPPAGTGNPKTRGLRGSTGPPALKRPDFKVSVSYRQPRQGKNSPPEGQQSPGTGHRRPGKDRGVTGLRRSQDDRRKTTLRQGPGTPKRAGCGALPALRPSKGRISRCQCPTDSPGRAKTPRRKASKVPGPGTADPERTEVLLAYAEVKTTGGRPPSGRDREPQNARAAGLYRPSGPQKAGFQGVSVLPTAPAGQKLPAGRPAKSRDRAPPTRKGPRCYWPTPKSRRPAEDHPPAGTGNPKTRGLRGSTGPPALKRPDFKVSVFYRQPRQGKNSPPEGQQSPGTGHRRPGKDRGVTGPEKGATYPEKERFSHTITKYPHILHSPHLPIRVYGEGGQDEALSALSRPGVTAGHVLPVEDNCAIRPRADRANKVKCTYR